MPTIGTRKHAPPLPLKKTPGEPFRGYWGGLTFEAIRLWWFDRSCGYGSPRFQAEVNGRWFYSVCGALVWLLAVYRARGAIAGKAKGAILLLMTLSPI
jgi:hypothetical protein